MQHKRRIRVGAFCLLASLSHCSSGGSTETDAISDGTDGSNVSGDAGTRLDGGSSACSPECGPLEACRNALCVCKPGVEPPDCARCADGFRLSPDGSTCVACVGGVCSTTDGGSDHGGCDGSACCADACKPNESQCTNGAARSCVSRAGCWAWSDWTDCGTAGCESASSCSSAAGYRARYFASSGYDWLLGVTADAGGRAWVVGYSEGVIDPKQRVVGSAQDQRLGDDDLFLASVASDVGTEDWVRVWGSAARDSDVAGPALDTSGNLWTVSTVGGTTSLSRWTVLGERAEHIDWDSDLITYTTLALAAPGGDRVWVAGETANDYKGTNQGWTDAYALLMDTSGKELGGHRWGGPNTDMARGIAPDGAGGAYAVGTQYGNATCVHLDSSGNALESSLWPKASANAVLAVEGGALIAGRETDKGAIVRRVNSSCEEIWTRTFGADQKDSVAALATDGKSYYAVGWTHGVLVAGQDAAGADVFAQRFDLDGDISWAGQWGTPRDDQYVVGAAFANGKLFVAGNSEGAFGDDTPKGSLDGYLLIITP